MNETAKQPVDQQPFRDHFHGLLPSGAGRLINTLLEMVCDRMPSDPHTSAAATAPNVSIVENFVRDPDALMTTLHETINWERSMAARWTASYGVPYNYAQMVYPATKMHPALVPVVDDLQERLGIRFNNCLLNYYQNERSKIGFHSDETVNLVPNTGVAIVSVGQPRHLHFRRRDRPEVRTSFLLEPGSMLFMELEVQHEWAHAIKKAKDGGPRISLTWRAFKDDS